MSRSILSIVLSVVVWGVLWVAANAVLATAFPESFDQNGMTETPAFLIVSIVISAALSVLAGWLCATIVRSALMKHVTVLALIQFSIGVFVQASVWELMPIWYHLIFLSLVVPMHLLGGRMKATQLSGLQS